MQVSKSSRPIGELSDDDLMDALAARDGEAFRELSERHALIAFRIACRMIGDRSEAEDVAQEAMLKLWNNADKWQAGGSGVAAWLTRVSTNLCLDRIRKNRRLSDEEAPEKTDETPLADDKIDEERQEDAVKHCIDKLGERQRAAVILTYYEEHPNQQAAETLEMKLKAFESLLYRARGSLKDCLESSPVIQQLRDGVAS